MEVLNELILAVIALATTVIMGGLKHGVDWIDDLPKTVKSLVVLLLAYALQTVAGFTGVEMPADPLTLDGATVNAVLVWLMSQGAHAAKKAIVPSGT